MTEPTDGEPSTSAGTYVTRHDIESDPDLSVSVIMAVAEVLDREPESFRASLNDVIDPDALDALFCPKEDGIPRRGGRVSFPFMGYHVTVTGDGTIRISADAGE